jgi:uncharacterized protein (DUF1697 family)
MKYAVLLRGINVGGKNILPMASLKKCLQEMGFQNVSTYIASGNIFLESGKSSEETKAEIEKIILQSFELDDKSIKALVLTQARIKSIVNNKPEGFGEQPDKYHSDVIFLMGIDSAQALPLFSPREGLDKVWQGDGVIYSQRLSSRRTKSRLNKIMATPAYKSMTIRNWNTTKRLLELLNE